MEGILEILKIGIEGSLFRCGPAFAGLFAQMDQQLCVIAGSAKLYAVQLGTLEEIQEFIIGLDPGIIGLLRQDSFDVTGDPGRIKIAQYADPLVALLYIKIAQVFKALNGVRNAGISQMGGTQIDPFDAKFRFLIQQRPEAGGKGSDPSGGFHTDDPLRRDLHQTNLHHRVGSVIRKDFIQYQRIGSLIRGKQLFIFLLTLTQGLRKFLGRHLSCHNNLPKILIL